jgi:DNA-binding IclR family transcriptional regulator
MPTVPKKNALFVTSLARGLAILGCFGERRELRVTEIARMTGLPQPTAWRLCHTLRQMGYLRAAAHDKMRLAIPALGLGFASLSGASPAEIAQPYMEELAERCGGAVSLGRRDGTDMIYLARCQGTSIVFANFRVGSRVPILTSPGGWAYLAGLDRPERSDLLAEIRRADPRGWKEVKPKLDAALADYERRGYVLSLGLMHPQLNAASVPVRSKNGQVLSLTCGGIASVFGRTELEAIGRQLQELAGYLAPMVE